MYRLQSVYRTNLHNVFEQLAQIGIKFVRIIKQLNDVTVACELEPGFAHIANGMAHFEDRYYYKDVFQYWCESGYERPSHSPKCTNDGSWSSRPSCEAGWLPSYVSFIISASSFTLNLL